MDDVERAKNLLLDKTCSRCSAFTGFKTHKCVKYSHDKEHNVNKNYSCSAWVYNGLGFTIDDMDEMLNTLSWRR